DRHGRGADEAGVGDLAEVERVVGGIGGQRQRAEDLGGDVGGICGSRSGRGNAERRERQADRSGTKNRFHVLTPSKRELPNAPLALAQRRIWFPLLGPIDRRSFRLGRQAWLILRGFP